MADLSIEELKDKLQIATDALSTIADTKNVIMGFYDDEQQPPIEMMLAGFTGATRKAREALKKMADIDLKMNDLHP